MAAISLRNLSSVLGSNPTTDSFNRPDNATSMGSTDTGKAWTVYAGTWGITGNRAYSPIAGEVAMDVGTGDMDVQVTIAQIASSPGGAQDLMFRASGNADHWLVDHNSTFWQLFKKVNGSYTGMTSTTIVPNNGDVLRVRCVGNNITLYINGEVRATIADSHNATATFAGLRTANNTGGQFDNFIALPVSSSSPELMAAASSSTGATDTNTRMSYGTSTGSRRITPKVTATAAASPPSVGSAATNIGWIEGSTNHPNQDSSAATHPSSYRISGTWTFNYNLAMTAGVTSITGQMTVICYAKTTSGATRELWRHTSGDMIVGLTEQQYTHTTSAIPSTTVNVGERLQYEFYFNVSLNPNAVNPVTVMARIGAPSGAIGEPTSGPNVTGGTIIGVTTRTTTDTAPATDAPNRKLLIPRALSVTRTTTDSAARVQGLNRVPTETAGAVDTLSRAYLAARTLVLSTTTADTLARQFLGARNLAETRPTTETLAASFAGTRSLTETRTVADTLGRQINNARGLAETRPTTDTLTRSTVKNVGRTESIPIGTSTAARTAIYSRNLTENHPTTDTLTRILTYVRAVKEYPPGAAPDWEMQFPTLTISGVVRDTANNPVSGATVKLFRQSDDKMISSTTSAANGSYSFTRDTFDPNLYYVISYLAGSPQTQGITERGLDPA